MAFNGTYDDIRMTPEPDRLRARTPSPQLRDLRFSRRDTYFGSPLTRRSGPPPRPSNAPRPEPNNVLGVFGLSIRTRERDLEDEFMRYGDVEKVTIVYDQRVSLTHE
jgi:transformer-2 protein